MPSAMICDENRKTGRPDEIRHGEVSGFDHDSSQNLIVRSRSCQRATHASENLGLWRPTWPGWPRKPERPANVLITLGPFADLLARPPALVLNPQETW